jgi:hypothetical protein
MLVLWPRVWPHISSDLDPVILGARSLMRGTDPYLDSWEWTSPGWPWPLTYPPPALFVALPLSPLPILLGRVVFVGASVALLALALSRRAWYPLLVLASGPVVHAVNVGQWSPLVTAGSMLPGLGWLLACKPNLGLSLWLGSPDRATARRLALGVTAAFAVSLVVLPGWPGAYVVSLKNSPHVSLIVRPFGWVLLLAAVRWRDPAARVLLGLALIPQAASFADGLPVLLAARTRGETAALSGISLAGYLAWLSRDWGSGPYENIVARGWPYVLVALYLPALLIVLRRRSAAS